MEARLYFTGLAAPWTRAVWWLPMPTSPRLPPPDSAAGHRVRLLPAQLLLTATGAPRRGYWIVHCLVFGRREELYSG